MINNNNIQNSNLKIKKNHTYIKEIYFSHLKIKYTYMFPLALDASDLPFAIAGFLSEIFVSFVVFHFIHYIKNK